MQEQNNAPKRQVPSTQMTIPLKQWCAEEAQREHVSAHAIWVRISRGHYPHLHLIRKNQRVVMVDMAGQFDWMGEGSFTEGTL